MKWTANRVSEWGIFRTIFRWPFPVLLIYSVHSKFDERSLRMHSQYYIFEKLIVNCFAIENFRIDFSFIHSMFSSFWLSPLVFFAGNRIRIHSSVVDGRHCISGNKAIEGSELFKSLLKTRFRFFWLRKYLERAHTFANTHTHTAHTRSIIPAFSLCKIDVDTKALKTIPSPQYSHVSPCVFQITHMKRRRLFVFVLIFVCFVID